MYNDFMFRITITENEAGQRLDRFLKKYFNNATLGTIYKLIRKDVKVNGRRAGENIMLAQGDELAIYVSDDTAAALRKEKNRVKVKKQFRVAYEDDNILVVEKPFGLLTHGDRNEKKNHLANQVIDYLIEKGDYNPRTETTFVPAPANRLDRNTTGLVLFGKNAAALQNLNRLIREKDKIHKLYLTIVAGKPEKAVRLRARMTKDEAKNMVSVTSEDDGGKLMETIVRPIESARFEGRDYTLVEVEILTGRTHQIRAHLAKAGYPIIGDVKYGDKKVNALMEKKFGLTTQLLHAYKLVFEEDIEACIRDCDPADCTERIPERRMPKVIKSQLPGDFERIKHTIFGNTTR